MRHSLWLEDWLSIVEDWLWAFPSRRFVFELPHASCYSECSLLLGLMALRTGTAELRPEVISCVASSQTQLELPKQGNALVEFSILSVFQLSYNWCYNWNKHIVHLFFLYKQKFEIKNKNNLCAAIHNSVSLVKKKMYL